MINEKAQHQPESQQIIAQSNLQQFENPMQMPLRKFTNQTYQQLEQRKLTLEDMSLTDLKSFQFGLSLYKRDNVDVRDVRDVVRQQIKCKEATAEKAANWWAAMGIIFLCLIGIITGGAYSLSQIQQVQTEWLKWLLICVVVGVGLLVFVLICKWIWPRRNIKQFEGLFEKQEE